MLPPSPDEGYSLRTTMLQSAQTRTQDAQARLAAMPDKTLEAKLLMGGERYQELVNETRQRTARIIHRRSNFVNQNTNNNDTGYQAFWTKVVNMASGKNPFTKKELHSKLIQDEAELGGKAIGSERDSASRLLFAVSPIMWTWVEGQAESQRVTNFHIQPDRIENSTDSSPRLTLNPDQLANFNMATKKAEEYYDHMYRELIADSSFTLAA